jgi:AcrR family transcriptional regulator
MNRPCRSEDAILRAALDLVADHGVSGLTVDAVAARAGVGKQTIYRHWGSRARLIHAAISCMHDPDDVPDTGSLRGDLRVLLEQLVAFLGHSDAGRVLPSLIDAAERDPELADLREVHIAQRRAVFELVLRRGVDRGELDAGTDLGVMTDLLVGPFFYRRIVGRRAVASTDIEPVLELVLRAVGAGAPVGT